MGTMTHGGAETSVDSAEPTRWERAAALFLRWRDGDTRAMDDLVRLMTPLLWHVVRAYGLDRALAEDVVQTTWLTPPKPKASNRIFLPRSPQSRPPPQTTNPVACGSPSLS